MPANQTTTEAATATPPSTPVLSYQKRLLSRRRRWLIIILCVVPSIVLIAVVQRYGSDTLDRAKLLYEQRQWLNYQAPPDQLILFQDKITPFPTPPLHRAVAADAILKQNADFNVLESQDGAGYLIGRANLKLDSYLSAHLPPPKYIYFSATSILPSVPPPPPSLLYCGGRTCTAGGRLIVVKCSGHMWARLPTFEFDTSIYDLATMSRPFRCASHATERIGSIPNSDKNSLQFFAGQPDPNDSSRFTIRYVMNGIENVIAGQLQPDGITLVLTPRGPLFTSGERAKRIIQ